MIVLIIVTLAVIGLTGLILASGKEDASLLIAVSAVLIAATSVIAWRRLKHGPAWRDITQELETSRPVAEPPIRDQMGSFWRGGRPAPPQRRTPILMVAIAIFWFCAGVAFLGVFKGAGLKGEQGATFIYFAFGAGAAFVGTVLTTVVPWGIRELWRQRKRGRITVLPPASQPQQPQRHEQ